MSTCNEYRGHSPLFESYSQQKATIVKYAAEHGIVNVICHFNKDFPEDLLRESRICGWSKAYLLELQSQRRAGKDLANKKISKPLILGEVLNGQVQAY